jgi:SAM-dependent methyltransferase
MSHDSQREFVEKVREAFPERFSKAHVLEIGSLDINGTVRDFFTDCEYVGIDIAPGAGVDIVCQGQDFDGPDGTFDVVISCEVMEHNPYWVATFENMVRLCRPGGLVLMTCAGIGRPEHGTLRTTPQYSPLTTDVGWDYYKNISEGMFRSRVHPARDFANFGIWRNWSSFDLQFVGIKKSTEDEPSFRQDWVRRTASIEHYIRNLNSRKAAAYRRVAAYLLGDRWFNSMRWIARRIAEVHS